MGVLLERWQMIRLRRLMNMKYKPSEVAKEVGVNVKTIYQGWLPAGAPCERDANGNIWLLGPAVAAWAEEYLAGKRNRARRVMQPGEGYCLSCRAVVVMEDAKPEGHGTPGVVRLVGRCPGCGGQVNRYAKGEGA